MSVGRFTFASLDQQTHHEVDYEEPDRYQGLYGIDGDQPMIARGSGLSYVAASFGEGVKSVGLRHFNRVLSFEPEERRIRVEAGMTIGALQAFLVDYGLLLPVQPGHPEITVGGCIACNVHGKNQYKEGLFDAWVDEMEVVHPDRGVQRCRADDDDPLFRLTCGGYGTTGIIWSAVLRRVPLPSRVIRQKLIRVRSLEETADCVQERKEDFDLLYSWNDLSGFGKTYGAGYVLTGVYEDEDAMADLDWSSQPLDPSRRKARLPLMNKLSVRSVSRAYHAMMKRSDNKLLSLTRVSYPAAKLGFYFDLYGNRGFLEHKVLIPLDRYRQYFEKLQRLQRDLGEPIPLVSMKVFRGSSRLVSYDGEGISFTVDVFNSPGGRALLGGLDTIDTDLGAIASVYVDSRLSAEVVRRQYPEYEQFKEGVARLDPKRRFLSSMTGRLDL